MVTMAQSATHWRNTHTHVDRRHSLTHFTSTQSVTTTLCELSTSSAITEFGIDFWGGKVPEGMT